MSFLRRDKSKSHLPLKETAAGQHVSPGQASPAPGVPAMTPLAQPSAPRETRENSAEPRDHESPVLSFQIHSVPRRQPLLRSQTAGAASPHSLASAARSASPAAVSPSTREFPGGLVRPPTEGYSPRLSYAVLPALSDGESAGDADAVVKDDYRGFHKSKGIRANVPPLAQPIKPRFRKKGNALLGKLMHSGRKDSDALVQSAGSAEAAGAGLPDALHPGLGRKSVSSTGSAKHKFRLPSISLHHHSSMAPDTPRHHSVLEESRVSERLSAPASKQGSVSGAAGSPSRMFDLDLNFDEMQSILRQPHGRDMGAASHRRELREPAPDAPVSKDNSSWKAPDSWDVTALGFYSNTASAPVSGLEDSDTDGSRRSSTGEKYSFDHSLDNSSTASGASNSAADRNAEPALALAAKRHRKRVDQYPPFPEKAFPILYGSVANRVRIADEKKSGNHIIRVFKDDNTFTTVLCSLETSAAELLVMIQKKFFLDSISNYQLSLYVGNNVKLLEPFEKPLKIQTGLLTLSGYEEKDNLSLMGREDLSSICKVVVENMAFRNLTHEEETSLSRDYINVDISSHNLKTIPIKFHQHTYEIEKLNVSDNPAIYIPLDFIQTCSNLNNIKFSRNGCSKFPLNFLEATGLTGLLMECNFLDEIPARISHLKKLESFKLNSNQLYYLPRSFGKLSHLVTLNLSSNCFQQFPECITELLNLQDLDLSYNDMTKIPDSIGKLTKLVKLNLSTNKLSKTLPNGMSKLVELKRLDIRYNKISNIDVLGSLPNLEVMYASKNYISSFSDKMERLRLIHFDRNPITSLEFEIALQMLTVLDLSKAKITALPAEFVSQIPHIEKLVLDKNYLVNLPDEMGNLPKLTHLSLFGNNIQSIPASIGLLLSLQYLDLHSNNIDCIPSDIWNLHSLLYLNVSSNILSNFPKPLFAATKKMSSAALFNDYEEITKDGRATVGNKLISLADSLKSLQMADNNLNEEAFESIALLTSLRVLNVSYNDFTEIPEGALARLTHLTELYLSGNSLTKLPAEDLEHLPELTRLFVNGNKLQTLPSELSKCQLLGHLDVGSNLLRYNISNWPYDWNWSYNKRLTYLNFSGNRRFEIKQSYTMNEETNEPLDSFLGLENLKVIGLMDVTLTTPRVPDQGVNARLRTSSSELDDVGYGVSDAMGNSESVAFRDSFIQKFRGNENEVLILSCDGIGSSMHGQGHKISYLTKQLFIPSFTSELSKIQSNDEIPNALRRAFLTLNREVNSVFASRKFNTFTPSSKYPELNDLSLLEDAAKGCCISVVYIRDGVVYSANLGDMEIVLSKSNADYKLLSTKHDPTLRKEFERIRASGGFVFGDGALDGELRISRGVGFYNYVPHTHSGPSISVYNPAGTDAIIIMASKVLWDHLTHDLAVDLARQEKDDPMLAAEKLRDYAICYGATDKLSVTVISLGDQKKKRQKLASSYMNLGKDTELYTGKKRRDRGMPSGDTALRRLNDEIEPPIGKLALVFTDIKNSTLLWDTYPVAMRSAIKLHNTMMRRQLRIVGGYEVKTEGDSFMVSFPTPTSALLWCFIVQNQLLSEDWPNEILETNEGCEVTDSLGNLIFRGLSVRMGIHWGAPVCELDMVTRRMDYFGPMVNRASRIESSADGGQIAVSSDFLNEMEQLYFLHDQIQSGETSLEVAYGGNTGAGEIIEKEINSIEDMGYEYIELGERKLKGLETPENIVLAFTKNLAKRFDIFKKRMSQDAESTGRVLGTLPVDSVLFLRSLSLRLEHICSVLNLGYNGTDEKYGKYSGDIYANSIKNNRQESDVVALLNHAVTRVEHCVAALELRQSYQVMRGIEGPLDFTENLGIWTIVDDMKRIIAGAGIAGSGA
ncbi:L domain-like protein [Metschnikowia bicuspidata var. bicuspidata NRRL YB-4993]|uniref:Adenylate cyclase n=1 Tax=Metschnikowia bicuspidata var. bicuspidata NRRL YB-4993 TaxID=869754 RepID=A0A1A0HB17_9ASCO|nr:L domain-like protein [Metschnikowia bicuspidata var. bicuspidata NRRL YB-4993]OBA21083.1 L domain-like protein [Metschnikowia bicuspidata var. bicuspidata NRRL YB-4993]